MQGHYENAPAGEYQYAILFLNEFCGIAYIA